MNKRRLYLGGFITAVLLGIAVTSMAEPSPTPKPTQLLPYFEVDLSKKSTSPDGLIFTNPKTGSQGSGKGTSPSVTTGGTENQRVTKNHKNRPQKKERQEAAHAGAAQTSEHATESSSSDTEDHSQKHKEKYKHHHHDDQENRGND